MWSSIFYYSKKWIKGSYDHFNVICMILQQLWPFWANLNRMQRYIWSKFCNFGTIFAAASFMHKTSVKIALHEPYEAPKSSSTSLIGIRRLSKLIFFTASMFLSVVDELGQPGRASSLISFPYSLNRLYHNWTYVLLMLTLTNMRT